MTCSTRWTPPAWTSSRVARESVERLEAGIETLLARASEAGVVRADVDADDVIGLVMGTCYGVRRMGADAATAERLIGICCEGLRREDRPRPA